jgi:hypothetical protein
MKRSDHDIALTTIKYVVSFNSLQNKLSGVFGGSKIALRKDAVDEREKEIDHADD